MNTQAKLFKAQDAMSEAAKLLANIVATLDGKEWDSDTTEQIACLLQDAGYKISEPR